MSAQSLFKSLAKLLVFLRTGAVIVAALTCGSVHALGLGDLQSEPQLGKQFSGRVEVVGYEGSLESLRVRRLYGDDAKKLGYKLLTNHFPLTVELQEENGRAFVVLNSKQSLKEPYVELLLEIYWDGGSVVRQYVLLAGEPTH
ncbi:hypothetical protein [Halioxenophilus sp. WMMB6]|uniref:type IV pilus assembly protein FimV n=1 Tax=Halioxenophilus sp. WMMB6 TaxID=3073815 RepID=UPI00295EC963|nr:hypothetical protein [Halioxenophilus sp. WMMB6]